MLNKNKYTIPHPNPLLKGEGIKGKNKKAMTLIEVMIAIFIFTLWIASVFMIITSAGNINSYNKNFIIASNLAREQVELIRNIRDTNYKKFQKWNMLRPNSTNYNTVFKADKFYKIENDFSSSAKFHIKSEETTKSDIFNNIYRLCLNSNNRYIYCNLDNSLKKTPFYKYIEIKQLKDSNWTVIKDSLKINSKVYWKQKWTHKIEIPTILADYKRL